MNKEDILKILEGATDKNDDVPIRLVRQAFEKLPEPCTDTISRQAAIDALAENKEMINAVLDSLTLDYNTRRNQEQRRGQINEDIETIKELPSAQPEVIRCKDCRFRQKSPGWRYLQSIESSIWYCEKGRGLNFAETVELDDYCSSAKRRTNG